MEFLPSDLENIINDYKHSIEYQEFVENHRIHFNSSLNVIKNLRNVCHRISNTESLVTIGAIEHKCGYTYCHCFYICSMCNNVKQSSNMSKTDIAKRCRC